MDLYEAIETICEDYCKYPDTESGNKLADICDKCPMNRCEDLRWADHKTENSSEKPNSCEDFFREPTAEERKAVADYIDSISVPTGVNVFDLMDEHIPVRCAYAERSEKICSSRKCIVQRTFLTAKMQSIVHKIAHGSNMDGCNSR